MLDTGKMDFVHKKSYEISYALWRVAESIHEKRFSEELFGKSVELIGGISKHEIGNVSAILTHAEILIKFGLDIGVIGLQNAEILLKEIGELTSAIADYREGSGFHTATDIDLTSIFSSSAGESSEDFPETKVELGNTEDLGNDIEFGNGMVVNMKSEMRQSMILDRIRQIGNCRLSDIQAILPHVSDRTIRYDLESMIERNLIERVGTGGRSAYYRVAAQLV